MIDISTLNPAQLEAVTAPDGPVLVIAGAGSGKTRTIVHRLAWLAEQGVPASDMLLLTFTRKASREMLLRATDLLGYSIGGVHGGTFHSFAFSVLRQYRPAWAEGPVTVMDSADSASAIQQCKERLKVGKGDRSFPRRRPSSASSAKPGTRKFPSATCSSATRSTCCPTPMRWKASERHTGATAASTGCSTTTTCCSSLRICLKAIRGGARRACRAVLERYRYIMVDEYQDTNRVQARLVRLLAGEAGNVMAVGDDAQSIYAFRGADVRNILDFPKLFPGTRVIRLEENYRSTQPVLDVANAVLALASEGFRKNLFTTKENTPKTPRVRLVRPMSDLTQANVVAARVEELLDRYQAKEIAVLFRAGYQSYHLEVALSKRGIKFRKYGGLRYAEAVHVRTWWRSCGWRSTRWTCPPSSVWRGCPRAWGQNRRKIYHVAAQGDFDALRKACTKYPDLWSDMLLLDKLREHNLTPAALIEMVIEHYTPRLQAIFPDDWPRRQQGLSELAHIASAYTDLEQFVADLSLETPEDDADEFDEAGRVVLSTIHSSKGLEWDAVILLDLVEDRFPSRHALVRPRLRGGTPPHVRRLHPCPRGFGTVRARHALQPPERRQ
ncbi:MAG: ATP-dependent helicase [Bilophila wadsworthia]